MKLKVIKTQHQETETEYELPVFLYFQDEMCYDTVVKLEEEEGRLTKTMVQYSRKGVQISKAHNSVINEFSDKAITTKEHFNEVYQTALAQFK